MLNRDEYFSIIEKQFMFLVNEFEYTPLDKKSKISFLYDVNFQKGNTLITVSLDVRESYLQVILFNLTDGHLPDYDNENTIHLEKLNKMILSNLSKEEMKENNKFFQYIQPKNQLEKRILKSAKELRLCMKNNKFIFKGDS
ncbi:MAG: hypothetical protein LRY73_19725 [Bacillus sp. (in: Bacteria)]|nr:hypothetical protein [Bacillus sp. (in: firmicutes)]